MAINAVAMYPITSMFILFLFYPKQHAQYKGEEEDDDDGPEFAFGAEEQGEDPEGGGEGVDEKEDLPFAEAELEHAVVQVDGFAVFVPFTAFPGGFFVVQPVHDHIDGVHDGETQDQKSGGDLSAGKNSQYGQQKAEEHGAGIADKDFGREEIKEPEAQGDHGDDEGEGGGFRLIHQIGNTQKEEGNTADEGDSAGQPGNAVQPVHSVHDQHDPYQSEDAGEGHDGDVGASQFQNEFDLIQRDVTAERIGDRFHADARHDHDEGDEDLNAQPEPGRQADAVIDKRDENEQTTAEQQADEF